MQTIYHEKCPICGHTEHTPVHQCKDYYVSGETFFIDRCRNCGFLFTQNVPSASWIGNYYHAKTYISHSDTQQGLMNKLYHFARRYMLKSKRKKVEQHAPKHGKILDYGTGTGYFANEMKQAGWQVTAIEKDNQTRQFAQTKFGLEVHDETALCQFPDHAFDVVTLWHVLEHVENLSEVMAHLFRISNDGLLVLALPNYTAYDAKHYKNHWAAFDVPRHLWHFCPDTLKRLLDNHGFYIEKIYPMPLDAFYVSILSEKYKGSRCALIKGIVRGVSAWCCSLTNKTKSSSLIYIIRKKTADKTSD